MSELTPSTPNTVPDAKPPAAAGVTEEAPATVTGVQLAQGIGHRPTQGFWAEAWSQVLRRKSAIAALAWIGIVAFFAAFSPIIASGHPLFLREPTPDGAMALTSPLIRFLTAPDFVLLLLGVAAVVALFVPLPVKRTDAVWAVIAGAAQAMFTIVLAKLVDGYFGARDVSDTIRQIEQSAAFIPTAAALCAVVPAFIFLFLNPWQRLPIRFAHVVVVAAIAGSAVGLRWSEPIERFDYRERVAEGAITDPVYTLVPFSPTEASPAWFTLPPGSDLYTPLINAAERAWLGKLPPTRAQIDERLADIPYDADARTVIASQASRFAETLPGGPEALLTKLDEAAASGEIITAADALHVIDRLPAARFWFGTDALGQDVLSQMLHACRLSISIGLISTSIAVVIGVTIGALMGYFGGWVDLLLYRVVEIFMAIPVLFLLIVAAGVLPRNTYVMMGIIGCFTWTTAARFTRAEFMKLRDQDFVQAARATGLPLRSILFRHMLTNGVTPVLVDASFLIAAAILIEAVLSFLGLGPSGQASWGRLLDDASSETGSFDEWLAIFPGGAIFLTALAYNLLGETLRDAIDPKLKKARV